MLIQIENPIYLAKAIDVLSELVLEVRMKFDENGLTITATDPANVAMVYLNLPKTSFSVFEAGQESLGINLEGLKKILRRAGTKSTLILEKQDNKLNIQIKDRIKRSFVLTLIEIDSQEKEFPNLEYSSKVELSSSDFSDSVEDCAIVSDACSFIINEGKFILEAKELNSARSEFSSDEAKILAENCQARYSLEYLQKFLKASKLFEKISLNFSNDHPLKIVLVNENIIFNFLLAPRVETED